MYACTLSVSIYVCMYVRMCVCPCIFACLTVCSLFDMFVCNHAYGDPVQTLLCRSLLPSRLCSEQHPMFLLSDEPIDVAFHMESLVS